MGASNCTWRKRMPPSSDAAALMVRKRRRFEPVAGQQSSLSPAKTWQLTWTMRENGAEASRSSSPTKDLTYSNNVENETTGTDGPQNSWIIDTGNICPMGSARIVSWGPTVLQNIVLYSLYTHESIRASSWACQTYIYILHIYIYYIYIHISCKFGWLLAMPCMSKLMAKSVYPSLQPGCQMRNAVSSFLCPNGHSISLNVWWWIKTIPDLEIQSYTSPENPPRGCVGSLRRI